VLAGAVFLVLEIFSPGFFLLVPGTVLIIIGILILLGVDIFGTNLGIIVGISVAIAAAIGTVFVYGRLTPKDSLPFTMSMDSLVGKEGILTHSADEETIDGKATIEGQIWSARSNKGKILEGKKIKVISSKGVHIVVEEVE
jgi:membrane protein implicated in regulation of membrane protease activity